MYSLCPYHIIITAINTANVAFLMSTFANSSCITEKFLVKRRSDRIDYNTWCFAKVVFF